MVLSLPKMPYKQPGTPIHMFWWYDQLQRDQTFCNISSDSKFTIVTADSFLHPSPQVNSLLLQEAEKRNIDVKFGLELKEVSYSEKTNPHRVNDAVFENTSGGSETLQYGHLVVFPPCKVPDEVANSPFVNSEGLITLDQHTLRHTKYDNVFGLGECTDLPTVNNTISAMHQGHVVGENVKHARNGEELKASYNGFSATPIFT